MMRFRRAIHGVTSSYILLAVTAGYSLVSIPLALHYLDTERFGLWALMSSLIGYLSLIDGGMTSSAARLIVDHKDNRDDGSYGSFLKTVFTVTAIQGVVVFGVGLILAGLIGQLLAIPSNLQVEFTQLVALQCGIVGFGFAMRPFGLVLAGHQRMDLFNYGGVLNLAVNLASQWFFFHLGFGIFSLSWATLCAAGLTVVFQSVACGILGYLPKKGNWGTVSWIRFKEIFNFGKDLFLVAVGNQLIMASQTIIVTRILGLQVAAVWNVSLRLFNLLNQVIWRIFDMSSAAFAEMMARGELARLRERYQIVCIVSFSLSAVTAVSFALCNSLFVTILTNGKIHWPSQNNYLLGIWMVTLAVVHCHSGLVLMTKKVGGTRYIYFGEGVTFVAISLFAARLAGLPAIIVCSIICGILFSGAYCTWRVREFFKMGTRELVIGWLRPAFKVVCVFAPFEVVAGLVGEFIPSDLIRLIAFVSVSAVVGTYIFGRYGIPKGFAAEILLRAPRMLLPALNQILKPC